MIEKVFTARALTKTYASGEVEVRALRGLDLDVWAGEVVVLLGPSGSGKSTLLNIMGGLDQATSGSIYFKDDDLTRLDDRALTSYRRQHVGFVFQFYNLIPSLTAYENVALVTEIADHPMRPDEALALVGLEYRKNHFPAELSLARKRVDRGLRQMGPPGQPMQNREIRGVRCRYGECRDSPSTARTRRTLPRLRAAA